MYNDNTNKIAETAKRIMFGEGVELSQETADQFIEDLKKGIKAPWVRIQKSTLGGKTVPAYIIIKLSFQPKEEWENGIFHNSDWQQINLDQRGMQISSIYGRFKFRKTKFKNSDDAVKKINAWIEKTKKSISEGAEKDTKGDKEAYQKFFNDTLKKYGVKSPAELKGDDEKKFYDEIDAGWKADDEKPEKNESVELEDDEEDVEEGLVGNLIKKGAKRFLTRKGRNDARAKKLKKLKSKAAEIRRSPQLKRDIKNAKRDVKRAKASKRVRNTRKESVELEEGKIDLKKKVKNEKEFESYMGSFKGPDILVAVEKLDSGEKHQKGTVGFFLSQQMSMKEETMKLDARRREFREKIKKLAYAKAKKMIQDQEEEELEEGVFSNFIKHSIRKFIHKLSPEGRAAKAEKIAAAKEKLLNDYQRIKSAQERIKAASAALDSIKTVVKDKAHLASVEKELQSDFEDIDDELEEKNNN